MSTSTLRPIAPAAGPSSHSSQHHGHHHHRPRARQRSTSRSSSSPSPPPDTPPLPREKRRSFSSRSPVGQNRRYLKYDTSPLQSVFIPNNAEYDGGKREGEGGFSTVYGASASSILGESSGEGSGDDRFVSARGGVETEVEAVWDGKRRSSEEVDRLTLGKGSTSELNLPERV